MAEIRLAGWMHDIGKITTPEHIVSKQVKLQFVMDRFELIIERCSSKMKDYKIEMLQQQLAASQAGANEDEMAALRNECDEKTTLLQKQLEALFKANRGSEDMPAEQIELVKDLASQSVETFYKTEVIIDHGFPLLKSFTAQVHKAPLIDDWEKSNLLIKRGTLTDDEREQIKLHADRSWRWLMELPFPRKQKRLPLYAGAHHEHLNGSGYPNGIVGKDMPMQARILAIADIFEALVANDRSYKEPMPLSQAMDILGGMVKAGNLDGELMKIFLQSGDYMTYAEEHLNPEQIDEIDIDAWLQAYYIVPEPPTK
jgi:response regulator RpfG family c-di-GMP phosphodiesterase